MKLREWRRAHGVSQRQIADDLDVWINTISRWENGHLTPNSTNMRAIMRLTNGEVTPGDFFEDA
jgi:transcriptional regulator with XRE-family HTH domain